MRSLHSPMSMLKGCQTIRLWRLWNCSLHVHALSAITSSFPERVAPPWKRSQAASSVAVSGRSLPRAAFSRGLVVKAMAEKESRRVDLSKEVPLYPESTVQVNVNSTAASDWQGDLLAIGLYEDDISSEGQSPALQQFDKALQELVSELIETAEFKGKQGSSSSARLGGKAKYVCIVGLGKKEKASSLPEWGPSPFQALGAAVAAAAKQQKLATAAVAISDSSSPLMAVQLEKVANGVQLGGYEATRFKNQTPKPALRSLEVLQQGSGSDSAADEAAITRGLSLAKGNLLARYLVEAPPNICTPTHIARAAQAIAESAPDVMSCQILEEADCKAMGMGCFLGVAECSEEPLKFIHLTYKPKGEVKKVIGLVGKGLTFDSGGYNLKVGGMIEMMKFDMGGAGAVLGAAQALAGIKPEGVEVHIITASCENMIDGRGMRPGDILQAANGKTVEVNNTDAEGRLTLADALWYAQEKCSVQAVVDIATLTGACMVALGNQVAGIFTPNEDIATSLKKASQTSGEKLWRMPMEDSYWEQMKSPIADMKNTGGRMGGAITAALFLREYVDTEKVEWAHVDIAGPAWDEKAGGATGFGATTLAEWAIAQGQ